MQPFNQLIDYIEDHLTDDISFSVVAHQVGLSEYHLRRTFSFIAGMSLHDYVHNRRLAAANGDLVNGQAVTTVAFKYGYQSVEGFSRAFRNWSGHLPSEVRQSGLQKTFPRLSFHLEIKGGIPMNFKIEQKPAFNLVGVTKRIPIQFSGQNPAIQALAQSITPAQKSHMHALGDLYPHQVLNASYAFDDGRLVEQGQLTQLIGFATTQENPYADLTQLAVSRHTWAIFPNQGPFPQRLQETWGRIYSEWLPTSGYELVDAPEISFSQFGSADVKSEIWIAVTPQSRQPTVGDSVS
ncbi:AraC family transcriptional regulator [Levilactobacillus angrenensis]|uniref:GyrI-like domain-containing protein n=1 Tax=Levilactobacillus angrenensis TaxID=2486020 RepID=A0ABW1UA71_9LACO|nr:AraC family transcriptional regulator [Levilactobacillus angrenensis]